MNINFKIIESNREIELKIIKALVPEVKVYLDGVLKKLKPKLTNVVRSAIQSTPEYDSLLNGKLKYEFGIPNAGNKLTSLINVWSGNIKTSYSPPQIQSNKIRSSISAEMIRADFSDVLYTDYAEVYDFQRNYSLPWLRWLLLEGRATLVRGYEVRLGRNPRSRTGFAIMAESKKSWKVPGQFSGTESNNWITRAIAQSKNQILNALEESLA